jgi:hypothetical protein
MKFVILLILAIKLVSPITRSKTKMMCGFIKNITCKMNGNTYHLCHDISDGNLVFKGNNNYIRNTTIRFLISRAKFSFEKGNLKISPQNIICEQPKVTTELIKSENKEIALEYVHFTLTALGLIPKSNLDGFNLDTFDIINHQTVILNATRGNQFPESNTLYDSAQTTLVELKKPNTNKEAIIGAYVNRIKQEFPLKPVTNVMLLMKD